jgi:Mycoplasma protein of unknown function, DUF285
MWLNLSQWNVSSVVDMRSMFNSSVAFQSDLSAGDVSNVEYTDSVFYGSIGFNSDIASWNVARVKNTTAMFKLAFSFNQSLCSWHALVQPTLAAISMFAVSGCADTTAPILFPVNTSSNSYWCQVC